MGRFVKRGPEQRALSFWGLSPADMVSQRTASRAQIKPVRTAGEAMEISAVWAAIRLRADLISTLPIETYRVVDGLRMETGGTPLINGPDFMEFLYSSQVELDRTGNAIGVIKSFYPGMANVPAEIDLQPSAACQVMIRDDKIYKYRISGTEYDPDVIWHEKQFTAAGLHVGMSPIDYAAYTLGQFKSVQDFATQWFISGNGPRASLKNTEKKINSREATIAKESWRATQEMGEPFVHGNDWEYNLLQAQSASNDWLEAQRFGLNEAARYFGVPSDLIDAAMSGDHVTYANVIQRNLQFLVMHLGPAIRRRENSLSKLLPRPRNLKFDENALLRMDPVTLAGMIETKIRSRTLAPSEARAMDNRAPMTLEQIEEFNALGLNPRSSTPQTSLAPMTPDQAPVYAGNQPPTGITGQPAVNPVIPPEPAVPPTPEPKPDEPTGKV
jgi:HK97 family phage portal protein